MSGKIIVNGTFPSESLSCTSGRYVFNTEKKGAFCLLNKGKENLIYIANGIVAGKKKVFGEIYDFYYGEVQIQVNGNFGSMSAYSYYNNAYAGSKNFFVFIDSCPPPPSFTPTPTPTNTQTPFDCSLVLDYMSVVPVTPSVTPTQTVTPTNTPTPSITPTQTLTPTNTSTPTTTPPASQPATPTPTTTLTTTPTVTPTITATQTLTPTNTITPTPTNPYPNGLVQTVNIGKYAILSGNGGVALGSYTDCAATYNDVRTSSYEKCVPLPDGYSNYGLYADVGGDYIYDISYEDTTHYILKRYKLTKTGSGYDMSTYYGNDLNIGACKLDAINGYLYFIHSNSVYRILVKDIPSSPTINQLHLSATLFYSGTSLSRFLLEVYGTIGNPVYVYVVDNGYIKKINSNTQSVVYTSPSTVTITPGNGYSSNSLTYYPSANILYWILGFNGSSVESYNLTSNSQLTPNNIWGGTLLTTFGINLNDNKAVVGIQGGTGGHGSNYDMVGFADINPSTGAFSNMTYATVDGLLGMDDANSFTVFTDTKWTSFYNR